MEAQERILIAQRPDKQRALMNEAGRIIEAAAILASLYAALDLGGFNAEALADVYATGGEETRRRYLDHAKAEVSKIESGIIRGSMLAGIEANPLPYFDKAKEIKRNAGQERFLLDFITVTEQGATLTEEDEEAIRDKGRLYLTDPETIAKYRQHVELIDRLNEFFEDGAVLTLGWFNYFPIKDDKFTYPDDGLNYAYFLQHRKDAQAQPGKPKADESETDHSKESTEKPKAQQNRKRGGVVKGIRKEPDRTDRGAELRNSPRMIGRSFQAAYNVADKRSTE